jgi:hypothetical protein
MMFTHLSCRLCLRTIQWADGGEGVGHGLVVGQVRGRPAGKRGAFLHARLAEVGLSGVCVRRLGGSRAGEIRLTRFLRNPAVRLDAMLEAAQSRLAAALPGRHVLAIQDTTVTRSEGGGGSFLHAMVAVDAGDGALLGLVDAQFLHREQGLRRSKRQRAFADKESGRWLACARTAARVCAGAATVTVVADREADVFECFADRPAGVELLIRAAHDRSLGDGGRLFAVADGWERAGWAALELAPAPGRAMRTARLAIRFGAVRLKHPRNGRGRGPAELGLTLVDLREETPPPGVAPLHWRLLTTHAVETPAEALAIAALYRRRWAIEQVFRTMKRKGFDIEALRIDAEAPRNRLILATLVAAVTVMQMVGARDGAEGAGPGALRPLTDAFDPEDRPLLAALSAELEGRTARQKNPHPPGSLAFAAWVCARLGGWTGYYGKPGPIVILKGWLDFQSIKRGTKIAKHQNV